MMRSTSEVAVASTGSDAPLLTVVVPAYNAEPHLGRALEGLDAVSGIEVVIIDDGSTDRTLAVAEHWAAQSPGYLRVIHQDNRGHGGAINAGLAAARGEFLKVLDADDWLDIPSLRALLAHLRALRATGGAVDAVFTDFVHERAGRTPKTARFASVFPVGRVFEWSHTGRFSRRQVIMMHAIVYRTRMLRDAELVLPERAYYVDNLFVVQPLARVRRMSYLPVPLYRYRIGREDQSVAPEVMLRRVDQLLRVNRLALAALPSSADVARGDIPPQLHRTLLHHLEEVCAVTSATLARGGTATHLRQRDDFWHELRVENPWLHGRMRRSLLGTASNLPGHAGRAATGFAYRLARRVVGFS